MISKKIAAIEEAAATRSVLSRCGATSNPIWVFCGRRKLPKQTPPGDGFGFGRGRFFRQS
jgi:hypothetical protein